MKKRDNQIFVKKLYILLFVLMYALNGNSQWLESDSLYDKVVLLREVSGGKERHGTGFILTFNESYYLVTAKHVAELLHTNKTEISFRSPLKKAVTFPISAFIKDKPISRSNNQSDFFIMKLEPHDKMTISILEKSALNMKIIANNRNSFDRNVDVVVFGYPLYDLENFSPITFKSNFSSGLMNIRMQGLQKPCFCYLLENPSMAGFSGGPVFAGVKDRSTLSTNGTYIVGIVTGTTQDKTGGKFAVITPTFHLLDLLK
jgi:Trypsin